jgi:hypothetical protein
VTEEDTKKHNCSHEAIKCGSNLGAILATKTLIISPPLRMAYKNLRNQQNEIQIFQWVHFAMPWSVLSLQTVETTCVYRVRGNKTIPLQAWTGPKGSRRLRLPDFMTIGT